MSQPAVPSQSQSQSTQPQAHSERPPVLLRRTLAAMRIPTSPLWLSLPLLTLSLAACGDDGKHNEDLEHALCADAAAHCDAGHDGQVVEDDGSQPPDEEPPPEMGGDHDAAPNHQGDAGAGEGDAAVHSDSDAQVSSDDGGSVDAHVDDAGVVTGGDATTDSDASTGTDSGTNSDAGTNNDAGNGNNDAGGGPTFVPVRFSATDHGASAFLSPDRLSVENRGEDMGNVRSDSAIAPGAGVFYFEAHREIDTIGFYGVGIATASASLTSDLGTGGTSIGLDTHGDFMDGALTCTGSAGYQQPEQKSYYGVVVDYRGASPRVHYVLDDGAGGVEVRHSCTTTITAPVFIMYSAARWEVGYQISINTGADTTNHPFHFSASEIKGALNAAGESAAANALVLGYGKTRALPLSQDPVLNFPADRSVTAGTSVTLTGTATDAEDGALTANITWLDISSQHHAPVTGSGGSFTFTPGIGRHPVVMTVTDSVGRKVSHTVMVTAGGTLPQPNPVQMVVDDLSDPSTTLISPDGLSVNTQASTKKGVRCNQGIFGDYWYFEAHRNGAPANEGVGLMIREGSLNPYDFVNVPWSMSINLTGNTWYNLNSIDDWTPSNNHYGFAVDYRGLHPIVHVIVGGAWHHTVVMKDVWTPIYPIVYGNPSYDLPNTDPGYDITVNFAGPFTFNPTAILNGQGIDVTGLQLGWSP